MEESGKDALFGKVYISSLILVHSWGWGSRLRVGLLVGSFLNCEQQLHCSESVTLQSGRKLGDHLLMLAV